MFDSWFTDEVPAKELDELMTDLTKFVATELQLYLDSSSQKDFTNSVLGNLALFELGTLNSQKGIDQLNNLLTLARTEQLTIKRLHQLLHYEYMRHGTRMMRSLHKRGIDAYRDLYPQISNDTIKELDRKHPSFWIIPLIKEVYQKIFIRRES